jgi:IcmF-related N-terminal domain
MLDFLERVMAGFLSFCQRVIALITPFGRTTQFFRMGAGLRSALHVIILVVVLVFLYWLNDKLGLDKAVKGPSFAPEIRFYWLPILFLLLYVMAWLGWWLWKLLGPEEYSTDFPDIDEAWDEALQALHEAGLELIDAPLFLVLGKPAGGEEALFNAAQLSLMVKQVPKRGSAPLHLYANRDGIYLTCAGASLLGKQAATLTGAAEEGGAPGGDSMEGGGGEEEDIFKTLKPKGKMKEVQTILARAREEGRGPEQLTDAERGEIQLLVAAEEAEQGQRGGRKPQTSFLKNTAEVQRQTARFQHLCRLIVRERRPYCPLNGIMLLIPYASTDRDEDAAATGTVCQQDLDTAQAVLQVHCPSFALICDLETAPGFREFVERFPAEQRARRLGQRIPLLPDMEPAEIPAMIEGGMDWICQSMIPNWVYKLFRLETPGKDDLSAAMKGNGRLYRLMGEMRERQKRFSRIFTRGFVHESGGPPLFGGCYIAGTGRDPAHEQAFVAGVFRRLIENQNFVSWTDEALAEEAGNQRWTTYGYIGLGLAVAALIGLGVLVGLKKS